MRNDWTNADLGIYYSYLKRFHKSLLLYTSFLGPMTKCFRIVGAMTNFFTAVTRKNRLESSTREKKPLLSTKSKWHAVKKGFISTEAAPLPQLPPVQHGLSPIASSATSYTPKSLSSSGPHWKFPSVECEISDSQTVTRTQHSTDIDNRLDNLYE